METKQPFKILSKICLNNWHYIDKKILTLNKGINFFTGHWARSTVIDALQIVLYANTDGRGFFNKAAADDSDRSLIEYLRGMVNISERLVAVSSESEFFQYDRPGIRAEQHERKTVYWRGIRRRNGFQRD